MIRRHFARPLLLLVAVGLLSRSAGAAAPSPEPRQRSAFFAFCMDTHDAKKRTLEQQAALLKELGYDGAGHLWLDNVADRLKTLDAAGLKLVQIYLRVDVSSSAKAPYDPRLKEILPQLKGRDTMLAILLVGGKTSDASLDARAVELLHQIAARAQPHGVRLALYPHRGDWLERFTDAIRVAKKANRPNVGVMFNLCHYLAVDDERDLRQQLESAGPLLLAVSINGSDKGSDIKSGKGNWLQPLDAGSFDMLPLLKILKDIGYRGPIGLQCYGIPGDAREHLARSIATWRKLSEQLSAK